MKSKSTYKTLLKLEDYKPPLYMQIRNSKQIGKYFVCDIVEPVKEITNNTKINIESNDDIEVTKPNIPQNANKGVDFKIGSNSTFNTGKDVANTLDKIPTDVIETRGGSNLPGLFGKTENKTDVKNNMFSNAETKKESEPSIITNGFPKTSGSSLFNNNKESIHNHYKISKYYF